jgi:hypothetical protein
MLGGLRLKPHQRDQRLQIFLLTTEAEQLDNHSVMRAARF